VFKRLRREFVTILGIALILMAIVFFNTQISRADSYKRYEAMRRSIEAKRIESGMEVLDWDLMRATKGTHRSGARFTEELAAYDGRLVDILGFMVPIREFRNATEFMVLPVPLECYFCESPPLREVLYVSMAPGTTAQVINEPVWLNGTLHLDTEPGSDFFYRLENSMWGTGERNGRMTPRAIRPEEQIGAHLENMPEEPKLPAIDQQEEPLPTDEELAEQDPYLKRLIERSRPLPGVSREETTEPEPST
jgi:hypothetical protein